MTATTDNESFLSFLGYPSNGEYDDHCMGTNPPRAAGNSVIKPILLNPPMVFHCAQRKSKDPGMPSGKVITIQVKTEELN